MIWTGSQLTHWERCASCRILHNPNMLRLGYWGGVSLPAQNKATHYTRVYIQGNHWTGSFLDSSTCDLIYLHRFLGDILWYSRYQPMLRWWLLRIGMPPTPKSWHQQSGSLTSVASDLGRAHQKVCLYVIFVSSLRHSPPRMKNQHGLNEEKTL